MKSYTFSVEISRIYTITVQAKKERDAWEAVENMQTADIADQGSLKYVEVLSIDLDSTNEVLP